MRLHKREARPGTEQEVISRQPSIDAAILMCIECWHDLASCRPEGFAGRGSIPFTAILTWADFKQLDRELTAVLIVVIRRLDHERAERESSRNALGG